MTKRKTRRTITGNYFVERRPVTESVEKAPTHEIPAGRTYIKRMSWNWNPGLRSAITAAEVATIIRDTAPADAIIFVDSSFIRVPVNDSVWDALLSKQVAITPWVDEEIHQWMRGPGHNAQRAEAIRRYLSHPNTLRIKPEANHTSSGYDYYWPLLMLRKLTGIQFAIEFEKAQSRRPTKDEFVAGFKHRSTGHDDRAVRIAWKGFCDYDNPNYTTDEQLVTLAVINALLTGRETTILTRDHDLMEQFYKLIFLIDTHYRSMLFAERYVTHRHAFRPQDRRTICEGRPDLLDDRFTGDDDVVMRPNLPPDTLWDSLLPEHYIGVNIGCVWLGDGPDNLQVAEMVFAADLDMSKVIKLKSELNGLNSDLLSGKNCHIWPWPEMFEILGAGVAIASDKLVKYHPSFPEFRVLDMVHAVRSDERFGHFEVDGAGEAFPYGPAGSLFGNTTPTAD